MIGPPLPIWRGATSLPRAQEPGASGGEELRVARTHDQVGIFEEPCGKTAEFPFRAGVGAGTEDDVEAFLLGFTDELSDVEITGEVVDAGARLVGVPEDIGGDGVETHGFGHAQPVAPIFSRNAGVVHFAGDDAEGFAVEEELAIGGAETSAARCPLDGWRERREARWPAVATERRNEADGRCVMVRDRIGMRVKKRAGFPGESRLPGQR